MMPLAVFIWLIGWTLQYFASKQKPIAAKTQKQNELTFIMMPQEEKISA
jgi:hypothetical protein